LAELQTQLYCRSRPHLSTKGSPAWVGERCGQPPSPWLLNIIIFGPEELEEKIGAYLSKHKMYLQDPIGCDRRVVYRNPHIIPPDSGHPLMTDTFDCSEDLEIERLEAGPDLLSQLMEDDVPLPLTEAPLVKTPLFPWVLHQHSIHIADGQYRHQKQALTFMMRREQGWNMEKGSRDIWGREKDALGRFR
jgi:SWI/SNF-related matrix-associated actin-dependent regulator of chromatin subfamily A3